MIQTVGRQQEDPATNTPERLPRRRCDYCAAFFQLTKDNRRFCSDAHRKAWHRNRAGVSQLANKLPRMIRDEVRYQLALIEQRMHERVTDDMVELLKRAVEKKEAAAREKEARRDYRAPGE